MEQNRLMISDDLLNSTPLEHHGTKGMKWGVWNAETRAKYLGGVKRFAGKKVSEVKGAHEAKQKEKAAKKQAREDIKAQRKELGMTRAKYNELRETTLKSHDPKVVAKGMQTLTDAELDQKLERLRKEDQITKMYLEQSTRKHQEHKARNEAIKANPLYDVGMKALKKASKGLIDDAKKDKKKKGDEEGGSNENQEKDKKKKGNEEGGSNDNKQDVVNPFVKREPAPYSATSYETVRKVVKESPVTTEYVSSSAAKSAATRGERLLSDGTVKAQVLEVIDVNPVSASSARSEARKALPSGRG